MADDGARLRLRPRRPARLHAQRPRRAPGSTTPAPRWRTEWRGRFDALARTSPARSLHRDPLNRRSTFAHALRRARSQPAARRPPRPQPALAEWPTKPITLIVPYSAGGSVDATARLVAQKLAERLKQRCWSRTSPAPVAPGLRQGACKRRPTATRWSPARRQRRSHRALRQPGGRTQVRRAEGSGSRWRWSTPRRWCWWRDPSLPARNLGELVALASASSRAS